MKGSIPLLARNSLLRPLIATVFFRRRPDHHLNRAHPYDVRMGIRASGFLPTYLLYTGRPEDEHNNSYLGCVPDTLRRVLAVLPDPARWAFIDLGCGKGRALAVASELPFRSILGIELSPDLVRVARSNARVIARREPGRTRIDLQVGDASVPAIAGPTVLLLYNSFDAPLVERLLDTVEAAAAGGSPVLFVYLNPVHGRLLDAREGFSRWYAASLELVPGARGLAPDRGAAVGMWLAGAGLAPLPGCDRVIAVKDKRMRAELVEG